MLVSNINIFFFAIIASIIAEDSWNITIYEPKTFSIVLPLLTLNLFNFFYKILSLMKGASKFLLFFYIFFQYLSVCLTKD